jgi:hypothetical protein
MASIDLGQQKLNLVFYMPFPTIKKSIYGLMEGSIQATGLWNGIPFGFQENQKHKGFNGYSEQIRGLKEFKDLQFKILRTRLDTNLTYIECPEITENLLSLYDRDTVLFIHGHGNPNLIGAGDFCFPPETLSKHLESLGLKKDSSPPIVVWTCNSGISDDDGENYAEKLRKELVDLGYVHPQVFGTMGTIENFTRSGKFFIMETRYGKKVEVQGNVALQEAITPSRVPTNPISGVGMVTQLKAAIDHYSADINSADMSIQLVTQFNAMKIIPQQIQGNPASCIDESQKKTEPTAAHPSV